MLALQLPLLLLLFLLALLLLLTNADDYDQIEKDEET
jgi:hypothetical protein